MTTYCFFCLVGFIYYHVNLSQCKILLFEVTGVKEGRNGSGWPCQNLQHDDSEWILNGQKMACCVAGVDLVSFQSTQKAFFGVTAQGGGDVAYALAFQRHCWSSLLTAKLVHGFLKEGHRNQRKYF